MRRSPTNGEQVTVTPVLRLFRLQLGPEFAQRKDIALPNNNINNENLWQP
jgi:hypothetical protein